jgi:Putative auto-transporter adhesin, head GIN domain
MKKLSIMFLAAAAMCSFSSCKKVVGEGPIETENRSINNFSGISSNIGCTVFFTQAPEFKVELNAQRNILNLIETYKNGNDLILKFKNNVNISNHAEIKININAPSLESIRLNGSGNVKVSGNFEANQFNTTISGSGNLVIDDLKITNGLTANISGSGSFSVLAGKANSENVKVSGSGFIDLSAVRTTTANVIISGSGIAKVNVTQKLDATISGSGNIYYYGDPILNAHISGSGRVVRL